MDGRHRHPAAAGWRLSLVIPAYNEEPTIRQAVAEADDALRRLTAAYEILVVDDGSRDGTAAIAADAARGRPHVRLLRHPENRGYGAALRTGFEAARFDRVAFTDADCQFDLADLAVLLPLTDQAPLAVGYRLGRQDRWHRRFFSWGYNTLARVLLGTRVRDCDCALKVLRREALAELLPTTAGFFVNTEMLTRARQLGYEAAEAGVRHRPRLGGASKVSLWDIPRTLAVLLPFWWSQVLFSSTKSHEETRRALPWSPSLVFLRVPSWLVLLLAALLLFFCRLNCPLLEPSEARYAEIPRQMLAQGSLVVPVLHGQPYYDKPPLLYWLVMASYRAFGVEDWAARVVPACVGLLTVLATYLWGRHVAGARAALFGAVMLCLSVRYVYLARMLTMDGLLCLWVTGALAAAHAAARAAPLRWGWWLVSAGCCALGVLTKGPVALALVAVPVLTWQFLDRRTARPRWTAWLTYLLATVALAGPWYVAATAAEPEFAGYFFWTHNVLRYVAPFDHPEPFWFYLPGLLLGMLPWTLLLLPLVRSLAGRAAAARRPAALGFFLLAAGWAVVFFSAAGCKRPGYILPAMPPLALALGCYLDHTLSSWREECAAWSVKSRLLLHPYGATLLVLGLGVLGCLLAVLVGLWRPLTGFGLGGLAVGVCVWLVRRGPAVSWAWCAAATFALLAVGFYELLPCYARKFSLRGQVRPHAAACDAAVPVACYPRRWDSVSFYLRRDDVRVYFRDQQSLLIADLRRQPNTLLFLKSGPAAEELLRALPPSLEFVPHGRQGTVTVGWVRPRAVAPDSLYAGR